MTDKLFFLLSKAERPDILEIHLPRALDLMGKPHFIALKSISLKITWYNIDSVLYLNHKFRYYNGVDWKTVVIPNGYYSFDDIVDVIHGGMEANNDVIPGRGGRRKSFNIKFALNKTTRKLRIELTNDFNVDFRGGELHKLLGFPSDIIKITMDGTEPINLENNINVVLVHCSLASGNTFLNAVSSDVIHSFVPGKTFGDIISEVNLSSYIPINANGYIDRIEIQLTDQLGRPLQFKGGFSSCILHIRS